MAFSWQQKSKKELAKRFKENPEAKEALLSKAPSKQQDVYMRHSRLLAQADTQQDPVERMLAVCRLVLCVTSDLLRPTHAFPSTPKITITNHYISCRDLGPCPGGTMKGDIEEVCTMDASTKMGWRNKGEVWATMTIASQPECAVKGPKSLVGKTCSLRIYLKGGSTVELMRHGETYVVQFPKINMYDPTSKESLLSIIGKSSIYCETSGMTASFEYTGKTFCSVVGQLERLDRRQGPVKMFTFSGTLNTEVRWTNTSTKNSGVLFSPRTLNPSPALPMRREIDIQNIGPMSLHRLWTAIHDAILSLDSTKARGRGAAEIANTLASGIGALSIGSPHLCPPISLKLGVADAYRVMPGGREDHRPRIPPCIEDMKANSARLSWQLVVSFCLNRDPNRGIGVRKLNLGGSKKKSSNVYGVSSLSTTGNTEQKGRKRES